MTEGLTATAAICLEKMCRVQMQNPAYEKIANSLASKTSRAGTKPNLRKDSMPVWVNSTTCCH
jgi:hypothetical protein